jgi:hypothetical protein
MGSAGHGHSRVSSATARLALALSTRALPSAAAAIRAAVAALLSLTVQPVGDPVEAAHGVVGEEGVGASH